METGTGVAEKDLTKDELRRLDSVVEHTIAQGHRVLAVPSEVQTALKDEGIKAPTFVRFNRVNPARRRFINEEVQRRYHRDLRNQDILSNAQVLKEVTVRGEWNDEMQRKMEGLQQSTTRDMAALWAEGLTPETSTYTNELIDLCRKFRESVVVSDKTDGERSQMLASFDRWVGYMPDVKDPSYEGYEPLTEQGRLFDDAPFEVQELLEAINDVKEKQERLIRLARERIELMGLQLRYAKIFADTAESRRDHTEEMAQLYFTCESCNEAGMQAGKLVPTFEDLWNFPDRAVKWLLYESYFFHQDIPDGAREYLATFGFSAAEREPTENDPSAGSLAPPSFKLDGTPAEATPVDSGDSTVPKTSTTAS